MSHASPASRAPVPGLPPAVFTAIIVTVLAWASAFIVIRGVSPHYSGGALALARLLVGTILLPLGLIGRPWVRPAGRDWLLILGFGVAWFGGYNISLNIAEKTLDAGTTAMVVNIGPILIAVSAGVLLREGMPRWLGIGASVAFAGVLLIGLGSGAASHGSGTGVLWSLLAAVAYTFGVLCQKKVLGRIPSAQVTWLGCVFGALACLPFFPDLIANVRQAPTGAILGAIYLGAVPTALAFSTWAFALSRMPAGQLGVTTYVVPALVVLIGFLVFGEIPAPLAIAGGVLCLTGVGLSRRR